MASDETPVEQRLRLLHDNKAAFDFIEPDEDADAIDCGREAIRLLRDFDRDEVNPADWDVYRRALLARCTEGAATTRPMCKCGVYVDCHPVKANGPHIRACNAPSPVPPMPHEFSVGFRAGLNYEHEWGPEPDDPAQQAWNRYQVRVAREVERLR